MRKEETSLAVHTPLAVFPKPVWNANRPGYNESSAAADLLRWVGLLRRRIHVLIVGAAGGLILGILATYPQVPMYEAHTSLEVQDINPEFMNLKQVSPVSDATQLNALSELQTQIKLLQSEVIADRTIAELKSTAPTCAVDTEKPSTFGRLSQMVTRGKRDIPRTDLLAAAAKTVRIRAAGQTRVIEVVVQSPDPRIACSFANVLVSEFIEQSIQARYMMSQRTGAWLGSELEGMRLKLEHSENALQDYARKNGLLYTAEKESMSEQKLSALQGELSKSQEDRLAKQSLFEVSQSTGLEAVPAAASTTLRDLQAKLTDLRRQRAELGATFKSDYSKSKKVDAQIAELESAIKVEEQAVIARIAREYQEARHHEALLMGAYQTQKRLVTDESEKGIQYGILKREVDTNRQIYEAMLQRVKESSIASAMQPSNIRVIDPAKMPSIPYSPSVVLNAGLGLFLGGMLSLAAVALMTQTDHSLQNPGETGLLLGVPELGVIPRTPFRGSTARQAAAKGHSVVAPGEESDRSTDEADRLAAFTNGFRGVVASILFANKNGRRPHVLVITSACAGEGKTTASASLAKALAQVHMRVLLIDSDVRRPAIHKLFNLENERGLANLLEGKMLDEKEADSHVNKITPNLDVLTAGFSESAASLFFFAMLPAVVNYFKKQYEMIIIDTPPMLLVPEARMLGPVADGVVLIARAGQTTRESAIAIHQQLIADGTSVLGVVLNDWDRHRFHNSYYGYSGEYAVSRN